MSAIIRSRHKINNELVTLIKLKPIGRGTFGTVYLAKVEHGIAEYAIKLLQSAKPFSFELQGRLSKNLLSIQHDNLVCYISIEEVKGTIEDFNLEILQEYCPGGSLYDLLFSRNVRLAPYYVKSYSAQIINGLSFLHDQKIAHGDLKANNLLLSGDWERLKLCDFDDCVKLARSEGTCSEDLEQLRGTLSHMAPEKFMDRTYRGKKVCRAADLYSYGCCVIEMSGAEIELYSGNGYKCDWLRLPQWLLQWFPQQLLPMTSTAFLPREAKTARITNYFHGRDGRPNPPVVPKNVQREIKSVIKRCTLLHAEDRPTAAQLREEFAENGWLSLCNADQTYRYIPRKDWGAEKSSKELDRIPTKPVGSIYLSHSCRPENSTRLESMCEAKWVQDYHKNTNHFDDVGFHFLIGNDGTIFECRGFHYRGAFNKKYNATGYCIAFMGTFTDKQPSTAAMTAAAALVRTGIKNGFISSNVQIFLNYDNGSIDSSIVPAVTEIMNASMDDDLFELTNLEFPRPNTDEIDGD